jgi:hypothetical protein
MNSILPVIIVLSHYEDSKNWSLTVRLVQREFVISLYICEGLNTLSSQWMIVSRVLVTNMGFRLVIGFINRLQVVTTINYNTVPDFYTTKHSTLISSVYLHRSSRIYHTGTIQVSLNHTSNITVLHYT